MYSSKTQRAFTEVRGRVPADLPPRSPKRKAKAPSDSPPAASSVHDSPPDSVSMPAVANTNTSEASDCPGTHVTPH